VKRLLIGAVVAGWLIWCGAALAAQHGRQTLAPPGNSGVSQYLETVPTDSGQAPPKSGSPGGALPKSGQQALSHLGSGGRLLGAVVSQTSQTPPAASAPPAAAHPSHRTHPAHRIAPAPTQPAAGPDDPLPGAGHGSSPISTVLSASTGAGSGLGWLVPAIVISAALAAVLGVLRRRTPQS
jgi:hypothetical protein